MSKHLSYYEIINFFCGASPAVVVGMQDNEYTNAQVGDAGGLFNSLLVWGSSSLPHWVLQFQSSWSSASDPVYLIQLHIQCCSSSLRHPLVQFHPVYLIQYSGSTQSTSSSLQFQSTLSSAPIPVYLTSSEDFNFSCSLFLLCTFFFKFNFFWIIIIHVYFILYVIM